VGVMPSRNPLLLYLRSRLSAVLASAAAALIVLSIVFLRDRALVPVLVLVAAYLGVTFAVFFSRRGAREIVQESEEDRLAKIRKKISSYEQLRERISVLRIGDEKVIKAIEYFLLESGAYLEKCRALSTYSPLANERMERVLEICQVYLGERDEESTERRYEEPEKDSASGGASGRESASDPADVYAGDIMECARVIKERTVEDLLGVSDAQRLAIAKELEKDT